MPDGQLEDFGGHIHVRLGVAQGRVADVAISSSRPRGAARVFVGRTPAESVPMLGALFSLCGRAQTIAGLQALERAQGLHAAPAQASARDLLRLSEMLSQTALRLCLDWPRLLGVAPAAAAARACLAVEAALEKAVFGGPGWKVPGGVAFAPDRAAARATIDSVSALMDEAALSGPLARQLRHALADAGLRDFGGPDTGLLARLDARLAMMAVLPARMRTALDGAAPGDTPVPDAPKTDGSGAATVETARGPLTHSARVAGGVIADYEIHAPTDDNFLPGGPVAQGLLGADATAPDAFRRAAELHVLAADPCVRFTLEIGEDADA